MSTTEKRPVIEVTGLKKQYKLGQIGGGTLTHDLQSWWARVRGKEDPNTVIGTDQRLFGQTFMALNGVDLTVYQGEALGIIGRNGAGKSTLLKLLSRITAPTEGEIKIRGRVASMLEVGTGFNNEMTGRENIYMNGAILGMMAVADTVKEDSPEAVAELRKMGIRVVMITGDNPRTAQAVGQTAGVDQVVAGVLPDGKADVVRRLQKVGRVAMVGDGINDAPALTCADVGIAIGAGTDIAMDAADVVLMNSRLSDVPAAIRLSRATLRNIHENLFWAFCYNVIGIPLAAGVFISLLGWKLNPMFGAAAMSLSSFCVVSNALRLNLFRLRDGRHDRALHPVTLPDMTAQPGAKVLTMRIDGMMCAHCEARVKAALEAVDGVQSAAASHEAGTAVVTLKADADENALKPLLKAVVEENDYEVKGFDK